MIKFQIEENITEYLDIITKNIDENAPQQMKKMARKLTGEFDTEEGYITQNMAVVKFREFNPNLHLSGQDEDYWVITNKEGKHSLEITYTGLRLYELYEPDDARVWWEFAEGQEADPSKRFLERDYSFFQETGIDRYALPKYARAKGAIAMGVRQGKEELYEMSAKYLENILNKGSGYFFM